MTYITTHQRPSPLRLGLPLTPTAYGFEAHIGTRDSTTTDVPRGTYLAPRFSQWGKPKVTTPRRKARDAAMARRLWAMPVELTGCDWAV